MDSDRGKGFADKVFSDMAGAMAAGMAYVGVQTGLFTALRDKGPLSQEAIVAVSGLEPRYVEEWLRGMVCAGYLDFDSGRETFKPPPEHAYLLASEGTDHYVGGLFRIAPLLLRAAPDVVEAFVHGGGIAFSDYGPEMVEALDSINSGQYARRLVDYWLKELPETTARLERGGRVLDVGCGVGRVSLALAKAYPRADVVGIDPDRESIRQATALAKEANLEGRLDYRVQTTRQLKSEPGFDLAMACDCLHDFAKPRQTLAEIRRALKSDGVLFVIEPKVASRLEENIHAVPTMFYGFSLFHCMTQSLAEGGAGLGTCMGPEATHALLREAGFTRVETLHNIKSQVNLFYTAQQ